MPQKDLIVRIGANTKELDRALKTTQGRLRLFNAGIAALGAGSLFSIKSFSDFESSFSDVLTLLDSASFKSKTAKQGVDDLRSGILDLRAETGDSFDNLNKGLFDLISAGVDAEDAIGALGVASRLAIAGATETSVAVDGLTSALNAYSLDASEAQNVADKFFTAQKGGKTTIEEISASFGLAGATSSSFGVSLDELLAATSAATTGGIKTTAAFTGFNAVLSNIAKPTKQAADEAKRLGIEFNSTALRTQGLDGFLKTLTSSAGFNSTSLEKLFGSVEALKIAQSLTGAQSDKFSDILEQLGNKSLIAANRQAALEEKTNTLEFASNRLTGSISKATVEFGGFLSKTFKIPKLMNAAADSIGFLSTVTKVTANNINGLFNLMLSQITATLAKLKKFVAQTAFDLAQTPLLPDSFKNALEGAAVSRFEESIALTNQSVQAEAAAVEAFGEAQNVKTEYLRQSLSDQNDILAEDAALKQEIDEEKRQSELDLEDERHKEDLERKAKKDEDKTKADQAVNKKALLDKKLKDKAETKLEKDKAEVMKMIGLKSSQDSISQLQNLAGEKSKVGKALFLLNKALSIKDAIVNTEVGVTKALASLPYPANIGAAAQVGVMGAINVATIAATAVPQSYAAQQGGVVPGTGYGDKVPFMLEPGELIVPKALTPNFADLFGEGGGGQTNVSVEIGLDDQASQLLTLSQREDRIIGVSQ